jgi:uncharacterized protein YceH (UPF0502 family)
MVDPADHSADTSTEVRWRPLDRIERRILGVLVEKAKTTPDAYPLSLAALVTGCNQKSNRDPQMQLEPEQIEPALERLRQAGAVAEISGTGRVPRYRHYLYEWLGVDKVELAVMAELLLRGAQTVGELRGRAARMEPIADVGTLMPVLRSLMDKNLVVALTPEGRGQTVTHALYPDEEMRRIRAAHNERPLSPPSEPAAESATGRAPGRDNDLQMLRDQVQQLQEVVDSLRHEVDQINKQLGQSSEVYGETD